jgi:hypothetical protein
MGLLVSLSNLKFAPEGAAKYGELRIRDTSALHDRRFDLPRTAEIDAIHDREVKDAAGIAFLSSGVARGLRERDARALRFSRKRSVSDRLVHGEVFMFRSSPWNPPRPIIARNPRSA